MKELPIRGRGASDNPPNRFESLEVVRDGWRDPEDPAPETRLLKDASRSIIAYNDSPDIPFDASLNPYRGCEHGCVYCISGGTPVLLADGIHRPIRDLKKGDRIYGTVRRGWYRRYVRTEVLAHWKTHRPAWRVILEDGTELVASPDHRFLTDRGWKFVTGAEQGRERRPHLTTNNKLMGIGSFASPPRKDRAYRRGYLCGLIRGDAHLGFHSYAPRPGRSSEEQHHFRLALVDGAGLERAEGYLRELGIETHRFLFRKAVGECRRMEGIRTHARQSVARIEDTIRWPERPPRHWRCGFLAGIFDAEGSYSQGILRISNSDPPIIRAVVSSLEKLGFECARESVDRGSGLNLQVVRLRGGLQAQLRFFHLTDPAVHRKRDIEGTALKSDAKLRVAAIEPLGETRPMYDITTGTGDFIADGVVSHNCYARPTHEYLGFSPGLDFETRIVVKEDAPELLRETLADRGWEPQTLALSGVTDPYQPVERRLRITRGCMEVLAEARHPVAVITKNHLVTRDIDLLAELARHGAASVSVSITTLRNELQRIMEPRTAVPARRLAAIEKLAAAGIPVGVNVAPVIPGLTEEEIPDILAAAAEAGAGRAAYIMLRLPHGVSDLFERWLEQHFPDRRDKVLNRIRDLRGGRLNDPRFGSRMKGSGPYAEQVRELFTIARRRHGLDRRSPPLSTAAFRHPRAGPQMELFRG